MQQLGHPLLDQPAVPRRVLGLDRHLDRPVVVGHRLEQLAQREHAVQLRVAVGRLVVELGPRVLPRREVEPLEVLEVGRRDQPAPARRTPQVAVVHADQVAVRGEPDVALEPLGPGVQRRDVGAQRVLGVLVAGAAVRDHLGTAAMLHCGDSPGGEARTFGRVVWAVRPSVRP